MGEVEHRLALQPIEELNAERDVLVRRASRLWARHGPGGTWKEAERKAKLAILSALRRAQLIQAGAPKATEASLDEWAHASQEYMAFITDAITEREELYQLEGEIGNIDRIVNRQQAIARYLSAEVRLA